MFLCGSEFAIATFPHSFPKCIFYFPHSVQYIHIVCDLTGSQKYHLILHSLQNSLSISSLFSKRIICFLTLSNIYHLCFVLSIIYELFLQCLQYTSPIPSLFPISITFSLILSEPHRLFSHSLFPKMITYIFTLSTFIHPAFAFTENAIYFYSSRYFLHSIYHSQAFEKK